MDAKKIVVVGSVNMDMVVRTRHIPSPGETVLGGDFFMNPGGKGANQAVAVARLRLGGELVFVSKIGDDIFGGQSLALFKKEGMDVRGVFTDPTLPSGVALITVDAGGENSIVVASGANGNLLPADISGVLESMGEVGIVLLQLEIPMETVVYVAEWAVARGIRVILNPAPAPASVDALPAGLLSRVDVLTPNETEASMIAGVVISDMTTAKAAALRIRAMGVSRVIITMGAQGALVLEGDVFTHVPAQRVEPVDTTAAGDVFNGALAVALAEGRTLLAAVAFAGTAAAISVTRLGAQSSIPYRKEIKLFT